MNMLFYAHELEELFNPAYLGRGYDYHMSDMVMSADRQQQGRLIVARIRGSQGQTYKAIIRVSRTNSGSLQVDGQCSCPVGWNCKHVAAALYEVAEEYSDQGFVDNDTALDHLLSAPEFSPEQPAARSSNLDIWLEKLRRAGAEPSPQQSTECLLYLLDFQDNLAGRHLIINTVKVRALIQGGYGKNYPVSAQPGSEAAYITDEDNRLLSLLRAISRFSSGTLMIDGASGSQALELMVASGRCHFRSSDNPPLHIADDIQTELHWELMEDTRLGLVADNLPDGSEVLPLAPPWYVQPQTGLCGKLKTELPDRIAGALCAAPPVDAEDAFTLSEQLRTGFPKLRLPIPETINTIHRTDILPVPCLRLYSEKLSYYASGMNDVWQDNADFFLRYGDIDINPNYNEEPHLSRRHQDQIEIISRDFELEEQATDRLYEIGLPPDDFEIEEHHQFLNSQYEEQEWIYFLMDHLPGLLEDGWHVEIDPSFRFSITEAENWYADIDEADGEDWFSLSLGAEVDGRKINLLPFITAFLKNHKGTSSLQELQALPDDFKMICDLGDGDTLAVPMAKVRHIISTLTELYDPDALTSSGQLTLSRFQSAQLLELDSNDAPLAWQGGKAMRKYAERLQDFKGIRQVKPPATLKAVLRDYQQEGLNWLQFLRKYELGGILADDMGLGKTVQALAHLLVEKKAGRADRPSLVVAPTSLMLNWRREAEHFAPSLKVLTLQGPDRKQHFDSINDYDLVLTTYPLLSRDTSVLLSHAWHLVILDEAQHIKNPRAKATFTACQLDARQRLCLTGTPMENHLGELWSQFHFLLPGALGDEKRFRKIFRTPIEKHADEQRRNQLRQRIAPFMLRRDKDAVLDELPPKTQILSEVELSGTQRDLYETIRVAMHDKVRRAIDDKGIERSHIIILDALLKLRQVCCHPQLLKMPSAKKVKHSAKLEQLMEMLPEMVEEGRRILLFSQFTSMLALIELELKKHGIRYVKLTGSTRNREKPIDAFQSGEVPVFLISLKAGGSGLNLTAADTVIHYDPWWNPAVERQATDRAHRIGQDKHVFVYKMIAAGTVEEKIAEMQSKKQALADALLDGTSKGGALTGDDLKRLFEPL